MQTRLLLPAAALVAALWGAMPSPAAAQAPGGVLGRSEVDGLDFRPDGAWRRRARAVRLRRQALLQSGNLRLLNQPLEFFALRAPGADPMMSADAVTGTFHVPSILIAYSDVAVGYPVSDFQNVLFSRDPGALGRAYTLTSYYEELSNNLIAMEGRVFQPVRTDSTAAYYQNNCNGIGNVVACSDGGQRFGRMLLAVLDSVSNRPGADTTWNQFDNDGPDGLPNSGDDDGVVDFVTFLQPTADGACGTPGVWSHRWIIRGWNSGSPYVTRTPRRAVGGLPIPGQFLVVDDYTIQSQLGGANGCNPGEVMQVGTVAHETGHAFGLPDLYDTDASSRTEGIGEWGLMGSGTYARPYSPSSFDPWSLAELGWVTLEELTTSRTVQAGPRQLSDTVFLARTRDSQQYFLLENRQAALSDTAQMNPAFSKQKLPGLAIWLVDEARIAQGRGANRVNTGSRQGVSLMQADGLNQLRTPGSKNRGDKGDSYPGSTGNTRLSLRTAPAAVTNFGEYAGFMVDQITQLPAQEIRFRFVRRDPSSFFTSAPGGRISVNDASVGQFEDVIPAGDQVMLDADPLQLTNFDRTRLQFLTWSNGGPRTQTLISGAKPDTVSASFSVEHRLQVAIIGTGSVTGNVAGNLATGIFLAQGASVTLTASPTAGVVFAGWQGDSTTANPGLAVTMGHPWDFQAVFVTEQVISEEDAAQEVLGVPRLTIEQKNYLDTLGNRNGIYDVGDYYAFLRRVGRVPPAPAPPPGGSP